MLYLLPPLIILLYLVKGALAYTHQYFMSFIGNGIVNRLRNELFSSMQRQPLAFFDSNSTGDLMSRQTYDVNLLQSSVTSASLWRGTPALGHRPGLVKRPADPDLG